MALSSDSTARTYRVASLLPAALLAAVCIAVALESVRLGLGEARRPGPGFFPFWLSAALAVVAVITALASMRGPQAHRQSQEKLPGLPLSLQAFLALCLYSALLIPLGFIPATFIFFSSLARIIESLTWPRAALRGLIGTAAAFGLFWLLGVRLPAGLWLE